jgi:hypothetical protein
MLDSFYKYSINKQKTKTKNEYTRKNNSVEPPSTTPYFILVCFAKSAALSIGLTSFSTVKKAAKKIFY